MSGAFTVPMSAAPLAPKSSGRSRNLRSGAMVMALLLIGSAAFHAWDTWRQQRARTMEDLRSTAEVEGRALELYFQRHERALQALRQEIFDADGQPRPEPRVKEEIAKALARETDWTAIVVSALDGAIEHSSRQVPPGGSSGGSPGPDWDRSIEAFERGATLSFGRGVVGRLTGQWVAPLRYAVRDRAGRLTHVIAAAIPLSRPISFWGGAQFPAGGGVTAILLQDAVYVVARHPQPPGTALEDLYGKPRTGAFAAAMLKGALPPSGTFDAPSTVVGAQTFFGYARLKSYPLAFVVQSPTALLWQQWWSQTWLTYVGLTGVLLGGYAIFRRIAAREDEAARVAAERERRLRESEERLALAVKGTRDGIWDWNVRTGEVYFSPRWKEILGFAEDELPNTAAAFFERLHPDDKDAASEAVRRHFELGEPYAIETRLRHKDGSYRWVHTRGSAVRDAQGQIERMVGSIADIAERKQIEESLRASEERYRQIVETAREGIWVIDANNLTTLANARMGEILGWKAEELVGTSMFDHMDEQGRAVAAANVERRRQGIAEEHEFPFRRKDGSIVWCLLGTGPLLDANGRYAGALAMVTDITERRRSEQELLLSETRLRQAVRATRIGIFDHDHVTDTIYWSPEQRANYGFSADETITLQGFLACVYPDDVAAVGAAVARAHDPHGDGLFDLENRIIRRYGQVRWLSTRSITLFEGEGEARHAVRTVGAVVDITERKAAEGQIRAALREKEVLLMEIYHRVKNNLQVIAGLLSLQGRSDKVGAARSLLDESANRVKSMALVHEQLYQGGDLSSINFGAYMDKLAVHLADAQGEIALRVPIRMDVQSVTMGIESAVPLGLIVNELVSNAYKHAYRGARDGEIRVMLRWLDDRHVELVVSDRGTGLPRGFSLANAGSLGMRLVVSLTEQLGGTLQFGANEGGGTYFSMRFVPDDRERQRLVEVDGTNQSLRGSLP